MAKRQTTASDDDVTVKPLIYTMIGNLEENKRLEATKTRVESLFERKYQEAIDRKMREQQLEDSIKRRREKLRSPAQEPEEKEPAYLSSKWINNKIKRLEDMARKQIGKMQADEFSESVREMTIKMQQPVTLKSMTKVSN